MNNQDKISRADVIEWLKAEIKQQTHNRDEHNDREANRAIIALQDTWTFINSLPAHDGWIAKQDEIYFKLLINLLQNSPYPTSDTRWITLEEWSKDKLKLISPTPPDTEKENE